MHLHAITIAKSREAILTFGIFACQRLYPSRWHEPEYPPPTEPTRTLHENISAPCLRNAPSPPLTCLAWRPGESRLTFSTACCTGIVRWTISSRGPARIPG